MKKFLVVLLFLIMLCGCESKVKQYEGEYSDSYSQRATMNCTAKGDKLFIEVKWANSSEEMIQWQMNASLKDNQLIYDDCSKTLISTVDGVAQSIVEYNNVSGSFVIKDGVLYWIGAKELENARCIFEKNK